MITKRRLLSICLTSFLSVNCCTAALLEVNPAEFDFGWVPENIRIFASDVWTIKNISSSNIDFASPGKADIACSLLETGLNSDSPITPNQTRKISVSMNTWGYSGRLQEKTITLVTGHPSVESYVFTVRGFVKNPNAKVFPIGTGVAEFLPGTSSTRVIQIKNNATTSVTLSTIRVPSSWMTYQLSNTTIPAGGTVNLTLTATSSLSLSQETSITFEAKEGTLSHRFTVAARTGNWPKPPPQ